MSLFNNNDPQVNLLAVEAFTMPLIMGGYNYDECVANVLVHFPKLDEYQQEDVPHVVRKLFIQYAGGKQCQ